jgi:hypothetical protein
VGLLNEQQRQRALDVMQEYLSAPAEKENEPSTEVSKRNILLDQERARVTEEELKPLLSKYLASDVGLSEFKSKIDGINKRNRYWGFKGIKGQMFFNLIVKVAQDLEECDQEIKAAIVIPENESIASSRIKTFASYIKRLGEEWVNAGNDSRGCPRVSSIPFFLSYFWQIQDRNTWPVYYTNSVQTMNDLNLWKESGDLGADYIVFKHIHEELAAVFTEASGEPFDLYRVEHVFWFKGTNPLAPIKQPEPLPGTAEVPGPSGGDVPEITDLLPESFVPPIISILPRMAKNEPTLEEAAKRSGTTLERAFEKYVDAAFTILGYQTKLLGQGQGRVPDGIAIAHDEGYALIWDAKIRGNTYSMGTDDRIIRDYIDSQGRELKRRGYIKNIYYVIISSGFADDFDDAICFLKMDTDVNEVALMEAEALVEMVDAKLRSPLQVTLGSDGLQRLFVEGGIVTAETVRQFLM